MNTLIKLSMALAVACLFAEAGVVLADDNPLAPLAPGVAAHAFDHLGDIGDQAPAAAASGANIIYSGGVGVLGYQGLPPSQELDDASAKSSAYLRDARTRGIRLAIGYVCATSIVKLETFDRNWTPQFRAQFKTPPPQWLQQDRNGTPLPSWYGGDYRPACMNNPDWRAYEKAIVKLQLSAGHDGIFFDNPTVHPDGCYCEHCMRKFAHFLHRDPTAMTNAAIRQLAIDQPNDFLRFRCTIAADFLADIRAYARTINAAALITCNNSLNTPEAFYSQCRTYGYSIHDLSAIEDLVVIEDMATQPRVLADGRAVEYGPVYEMLAAIAHGKPIVACVLAESDYHTPPNLMRLAMAEAAAHGASYLSWPTWPTEQRQRMIDAVRPEADFLRQHADLLDGATARADVLLFLPMRRWIDTSECEPLKLARALAAANVQFRAVSEDDLVTALNSDAAPRALVAESADVLQTDAERAAVKNFRDRGGQVFYGGGGDILKQIAKSPAPRTLSIQGPPTVCVIVREKAQKLIVHLLNLDVRRLSSFEDQVRPAHDVRLRIACPAGRAPTGIRALSADQDATRGVISFKTTVDAGVNVIEFTIPAVSISTILSID